MPIRLKEFPREIPCIPAFFLITAAFIITILTVAQITFSIKTWSNLNHVSGAWLTLATDVQQGIFYRPLYSEITGYGGTRFLPLQFLLHGSLTYFIVDPLSAGFFLNISAGFFLSLGVFVFLKALELDSLWALFFCILVFANSSVQNALTNIRGDLLPVALIVWGLVFCVRSIKDSPHIVISAIFLSLAVSAKVTACYGFFAAFGWLLLNNHTSLAKKLFLYWLLGISLMFILFLFASEGRFLNIMAMCASANASLETVVKSPLRIARRVLTYSLNFALSSFLAAGTVFFASFYFRKILQYLPIHFLFSSIIITIIIFGSPGTESNHFIDLHISVLLLIAIGLATETKFGIQLKHGVLVLLSLIVIIPLFGNTMKSKESNRFKEFRGTVSYLKSLKSPKPILSENPLIPFLARESIWMQDAFMYPVFTEKDKSLANPLQDKIKEQHFRAVVFIMDPLGDSFYRPLHLGKKNIQHILNYYTFAAKIGEFWIYIPKNDEK